MTAIRSAARQAVRPQLEELEDRTAPAILLALTASDRLLAFDSANPGKILKTVKVSGLAGGENLVTLDARPANGLVYGVSNRNLVYQLDLTTGAATRISTPPAGVALGSPRAAIDFNPTVDRIRLVTPGDRNLRLNPNDGAVVDGDPGQPGVQPDTPLAYAVGDSNEGANPNVAALAYTNNFLGAASTTLFGIDSTRNALIMQGGVNGVPSPNGGALTTIGALNVNVGPRVGFDIAPEGTAYVSFQGKNGKGPATLGTINLTTAELTAVGKIGKGQAIDDLTVLYRQEVVYGVTLSNRLIRFHAADPGRILASVPINGLLVSENVLGIDFRPATGELFALTSSNRILRLDPATGQAVAVGIAVEPVFLANQPSGMDFSPTVDRIRLVNSTDDNLRYNPVTFTSIDSDGVTPGFQADTDLAYPGVGDPGFGQNPNVVALAYDRNDNDGTTATTAFGIDADLNTLVRLGGVDGAPPPNGGVLTTINFLGVDPTSNVGLDIAGVRTALAVMELTGETESKLFAINLSTGAATMVGVVGGSEVLRDLAIAPQLVQFSAASYSVKEKAGAIVITLTRSGGSEGVATVSFATDNGTASAGADYTSNITPIVFLSGETSKTVTVLISNDAVKEPHETVFLNLTNPGLATVQLGGIPLAVLTILNDD